MSTQLAVVCLLLLQTGAHGFGILPGKSLNHLEITESALLNTTVHVCRALAQAEGTDFTFPSQFTAESVATACNAPKSSKSFRQAILSVIFRNVRVDLRHTFNASFHFDEESFVQGRNIITEGIQAVKASNKQENYETARENLGQILHPLQDFYSHSNWVEMGNKLPNANLIRSDTSIGNIADVSRATCRNCDGDDCTNNILDDIIEEKILTSGYFGVVPFVSTKPAGKCSHGGAVDQTSKIEPKGGINKDTFESSHGHLHTEAANMAMAATSQLLEDIRGAAGDKPFLQMMGISKGSSKALCFVIDTTESMSDDIAAVKTVTSSIINSEVGTDNEPSVYILVPFNDPDFGPLIKTTDPDVFKNAINSLSASGGGDEAEMSLSGLQLALTAAPLNSEIFLFTDGPAKDKQLRNTVIALIERTQTVVNFLITASPLSRRLRRSDANEQLSSRISTSDAQLYRDLAQASGGESQQSSDSTGSLITASQSVGNFKTLQLKKQVGQWTIRMVSTNPYALKVVGQSPIDFLFDFVEESQGLFTGFDSLDTRPRAGAVGMLLVSLTGSDTATVTEVALVESSGSGEVIGTVQPQERGNFLVHVDRIPTEEFVVRVTGRDGSIPRPVSTVFFQRQSPTSFRASNLTITADSNSILVPGTPFSVPFSVETNGTGGNITIKATNSRGFDLTSPTSLFLETGNSTNGTVSLSAPLNTPSGTDVTLTIEAEAPGSTDTNYVVLRFSVVNTVTDFTKPTCQLLSLNSNCSENCSLSTWELSARATDGDDGVGVERVSLRQGNGTLNTSLDAGNGNITLVSYSSSCCSPELELLVVDRVGNVGSCLFTVEEGFTAAISSSTREAQSLFFCLNMLLLGLYILTDRGFQ